MQTVSNLEPCSVFGNSTKTKTVYIFCPIHIFVKTKTKLEKEKEKLIKTKTNGLIKNFIKYYELKYERSALISKLN